MATVSANMVANLTVGQTFTDPFVGTQNTITHSGMDVNRTLNASSTPPATKVADFQKALSSGAGTIDFTALPGATSEETIVGTGLKVRIAKLRNPSTNANAITVTFGASSPLNLFGAAFVIVLQPGDEYGPIYLTAGTAIGSGAKNVDLAGTGAQALDCLFVLG